jgi:hypothetical protein
MEFEMENIRRSGDCAVPGLRPDSPIVEIFSRLAEGRSLEGVRKADRGAELIKSLAQRANAGDGAAIAELNEIRALVLAPKLEQDMTSLAFLGKFEKLGYNETIEVESRALAGEKSRIQAANGDVAFPVWRTERYSVATETISGGYAMDYRRLQMGDMEWEGAGLEQVRTDIRNKAQTYVLKKVFDSVKGAKGVKFYSEGSGIVKAELDRIITCVRRFGNVTLTGDYSMVSQLNGVAGYEGSNPSWTGVSQKTMDEIRKTGLLGVYNGAAVVEIRNAFDETRPLPSNDGFETLFPQGCMFVLPSGAQTSPIRSWTRGGLMSVSGTDVKTGRHLTRFDLEIAADVERGQEHKIGLIIDVSLPGAEL